jgi:hypothetical protein
MPERRLPPPLGPFVTPDSRERRGRYQEIRGARAGIGGVWDFAGNCGFVYVLQSLAPPGQARSGGLRKILRVRGAVANSYPPRPGQARRKRGSALLSACPSPFPLALLATLPKGELVAYS